MLVSTLEEYIKNRIEKFSIVNIYDCTGNTVFTLSKPEQNKRIANFILESKYNTKENKDKLASIFSKSILRSHKTAAEFIITAAELLNISLDRLVTYFIKERNELDWVTNYDRYLYNKCRIEFSGSESINNKIENYSASITKKKNCIINIFYNDSNVKQEFNSEKLVGGKGVLAINNGIDFMLNSSNVPNKCVEYQIIFGCNNCNEELAIPAKYYYNTNNTSSDIFQGIINNILLKLYNKLPPYHTCTDISIGEKEIGIIVFKRIKICNEILQIFPDKHTSFEVNEEEIWPKYKSIGEQK
jgi:hypothetical protein